MTDLDPAVSPLAALTHSTRSALNVRPSIASRSLSSQSIHTSTHPSIRLEFAKDKLPQDIAGGVAQLVQDGGARGNLKWSDDSSRVGRPRAKDGVWKIKFVKDSSYGRRFTVKATHEDFTGVPEADDFVVTVTYNRPIEAFRGLGHILSCTRGLSSFTHPDIASGSQPSTPTGHLSWSGDVGDALDRDEECVFETVGVMIDCSRNGVMRVDMVERLLRWMALSGTNVLQLYCEDTYQIPGEPFFGYFRGPYTADELRRIDDYAYSLGIEVIACIQTLGHLGQMLQWNKYAVLRDTAEVLLAESVESYQFIEKMIRAISLPLRSKRIHIGMDEAHGVSEGRYRQFFGYKDSTQVFVDHLRRVNDICTRNGLQPMIWSDMLFCLPAKNNALSAYYDPNASVAPELSNAIPDSIGLVFWNYYQSVPKPYVDKIRQHWELAGKAPWMASGVWTWSRFWTALPFTFATVKAALNAAKDPSLGVKAVMTTIWGDEGNECDVYSALPGIFYHAEQAYTRQDEVDVGLLRRRFDGIGGGDFDDYVYASKLDDTQAESQPIDAKTHYTPNIAKFLLWEEPFFSFLSPQYQGYDLESHYGHVATYLAQATSDEFSTMNTIAIPHSIKDFPLNSRLHLPCLLARILALKCHLRERLVRAYRTEDWVELDALAGPGAESRLSRLRKLVKEMHDLHRSNWYSMYKPFGFEVLDLRYGGLESRLETMHRRLIAYLDRNDSSVDRIEELEVELETVYPGQGPNLMVDYQRASRPQYI